MPPSVARMLLLIVVLTVNGCGTIGNLQDRDKVYGGLRLDGKEAFRACNDLIHPPQRPDYSVKQNAAIIVLASIDLPLSALADTATLPITIPTSIHHWLKDRDTSAIPAAPPPPAAVPARLEVEKKAADDPAVLDKKPSPLK